MKNVFVFIFFLIYNFSIGQSLQNDFAEAFKAKDTLKQLQILNEWEKAESKNPELYTAFFNYYIHLAKKEVISLTSEQPNSESLVLTDSLNRTAGYLGSQVYYDDNLVKKAFEKIDRGIKLHPDRLDMRFGKTYAVGQIENWDGFTAEILNTLNRSKSNKNNWLWTNNLPKEDGKSFMLSAIHSYQIQLYDTENDDLLTNMQRIALAVLAIYPDHIESMSNLSITYFLTKEYDKGIEILLKAEQLNPTDYIILSNIAHGYNLKGNKTKAIEYYEKTILHGNEDAKAFAKEKIEKLKK